MLLQDNGYNSLCYRIHLQCRKLRFSPESGRSGGENRNPLQKCLPAKSKVINPRGEDEGTSPLTCARQ